MEERNNRNSSLRKRSSRRRRKASIAGNNDKASGLLNSKVAIVIVVVVVLIALVLGLSFCGKDNVNDETTDSGENYVETTGENETVIDPSSYELQKDAIPEVNELVDTYFTVMKNADAEGYMNVVVGDEMTQDKLAKKGEFIEDYRNIICYTKPGMTNGEHVAFVYYEIKFHNIDTAAPAMIRLYICSNENGTMYINAGDLGAELSEYINIVSDDQELIQLAKQTDQSLKDACASDDKLNALYNLLIDGGEQPTEPETTQEPETGIDEMVFEERNEKVYAITSVRVRSTPTTDSDDNILGKIEAGDELKRVGYNDSWSKVIYNGKEAYVSSDYVITK